MTSIPLADAPELLPAARRTAVVRGLLAGLLLATVAMAYLVAPSHDLGRAFAAGGLGNVIVLDQSGSIDNTVNDRMIRKQLLAQAKAAGASGRIGLVLFSDSALETLPPTAPGRALRPFARFFEPLHGRAAALSSDSFPPSPWGTFIGGTIISSGLREAIADLHRAGMRGGNVLLVSDLVDDPVDQNGLLAVLHEFAHSKTLHLQVRALPSGLSRPLALYRRILGPSAVQEATVAPEAPAPSPSQPLSLWLIGAAALTAVALAVHELLASPLRWRRMLEEAVS
ncbi:MAG: VWA domain-containing protein [Actinobacteria bacterium]|nr:VWA domain-containing protein [Actinomycetota bacterium]